MAAILFAGTSARAEGEPSRETTLDVRSFKVAKRESGPENYYQLVEDPAGAFIHAVYRPPLETVVLATEVPEALRRQVKKLRWKWRALVLPKDKEGDEVHPGCADSAAAVYVTFKRGLKWYSLKYVWNTAVRRGTICDRSRNIVAAQDTIVLESGLGSGAFVTEEINLAFEFQRHFGYANPEVEVPDFVGVGIMTDGDQTRSPSEADYTGFTLIH